MSALFLGLGILTQYFDFLTYPFITCAFPLIYRMKLHQNQEEHLRTIEASRVVLQSTFLWLAGYLLTWVCKMLLADLFSEVDGVDFMLRIVRGVIAPGPAFENTFFYWYAKTIYYAILHIATPGAILTVAAAFIFWATRFCRVPNKMKRCKESIVFLIIALLGVLWLAVSNRTLDHVQFQYRSLGITLFGCMAFLSQTIRKRD